MYKSLYVYIVFFVYIYVIIILYVLGVGFMFKSNIDLNDFEQLISCCVFPNSFIRNGKITAQEKVLFEILCSYDFLDCHGERKGWCDVGLERVADEIGLSKRQVQIHLKRLVEKGFVTIIYRNCNTTSGTDRRSSIYILNILPGLSESDRTRIASTRTIEIKNKISGLNTIKVQTSKGMEYIAPEEFDLEYLVTGRRSSQVFEGEIGEVEIEDEETAKPTTKTTIEDDEFRITTGRKIVDPAKLKKKDVKDPSYYSEDPVVRMMSGNYSDLKPIDMCNYFGTLYKQTYPNDPPYILSRKLEIPHIKRRIEQVGEETLAEMIKYFIENYDRLFKNERFPRPAVYSLGADWIWKKLSEHYARATEFIEEEKQRESIQVQIKDSISWDDL